MNLKIKRLDKDLPFPKYETSGSAGMDLYAAHDEYIRFGETTIIKSGIAIELPNGYEAQIRPRSGLAAKHGITVVNSPGTIDSDYRGELMIIMTCMNKSAATGFGIRVNRGDRIAQMVIAPVDQAELIEVEELDETVRGEGGFGSTGT